MLHKSIKHIHRFRIAFLLFFSVCFMFMLGINPVNVSKFIGSRMGLAVGMSVGVEENPFNKLALELKNKENQLNEREQELDQKEMALNAENKKQDFLIMTMGFGIWVLFCLILINFYLDYKKRKKLRESIGNNSIRIGRGHMKI